MMTTISRPSIAFVLRTFCVLAGLFGITCGCHKEPLHDSYGNLPESFLHWFENEKVAYLFFSIQEAPERLLDPSWSYQLNATTTDGGYVTGERILIDFNQGVHLHQIVPCGEQKFCGSFSFKAETAPISGDLIFRYDRQSPLEVSRPLDIFSHPAGSTSSSYSALAFGVFDEENKNLQVRIHDNFGFPNSTDLSSYGMTRRYQVGEIRLAAPTLSQIGTETTASGSPLIFPAASLCPPGEKSLDEAFSGASYWVKDLLSTEDASLGVCFSTQFLDKNNSPLLKSPIGTLGRRNPVLVEPTYHLSTPLKEMVQLPVILKICDDEPFAGAMVDQDFLNYQKYILDLEDRPTDLCFRTVDTQAFKEDLKTLLETRLSEAKQAATDNADFVFVILFHHKFSSDFRDIHNAIVANLNVLAKSEADKVSPRLAGSFVYEAGVSFRPTAEQQKYTIWCPQELATEAVDPLQPLANENCTTLPTANIDLKIINFVTPLGPLPSLKAYTEYVKKYGDKGLAHRPSLHLYSVPYGNNTMREKNTTVSFFDGERYSIGVGESAKFCFEREGSSLESFRFRTDSMAAEVQSYDSLSINNIWSTESATGSWRVGLFWEFPFWGGINYKGALSGKVGNVVPFTKSFSQYTALGDTKWQEQDWDLGHFIQHCHQFCDNPIFDEAGVYQPQTTWREGRDYRCPIPKPPHREGT